MERSFDSLWALGDYVSIQFPGNGIINKCKVIKVAFSNSKEPLYDVDVPFKMVGEDDYDGVVHTRLHGIREWHLRIPGDVDLATGTPIAESKPVSLFETLGNATKP